MKCLCRGWPHRYDCPKYKPPKRLKARSTKKQADINERKAEAKRREAAYGGIPPCVRCERPAEVLHHVIRQSQGGTNDPDNLINLCGACHEHVHSFVAEAKEKGWLA